MTAVYLVVLFSSGLLIGALALVVVRRRYAAYLAATLPAVGLGFLMSAFGAAVMRETAMSHWEFAQAAGLMALFLLPFIEVGAFLATRIVDVPPRA